MKTERKTVHENSLHSEGGEFKTVLFASLFNNT